MIRLSFTITHLRNKETINSFRPLLLNHLFQGIEIFYPYQLDELKFNEYTKAIKDLIKDINDLEIVLHLPHGSNNDLEDSDKNNLIMQRLYKAIDYGRMFGVKKYTLHLGYTDNKTREEYLNIAIDNLKKLCAYAKEEYIMIENMPSNGEVAYNLEEMKYLLTNLGLNNCKITYDTGHGHVSMKDLEKEKEFLSVLKPYIYHFHINDNDGSRDMHSKIGLGNINFKELFKDIKGDYKGLYTLEILYNDANDLINNRLDFLKALNE